MARATLLGTSARGRQGRLGFDGTSEQKEMQLVFFVETTSKAIGAQEVLTTAGLPQLFSFYDAGTEFDHRLRCRSLEPIQLDENPVYWEVVATFDLEVPDKIERNDALGENDEDDLPEDLEIGFEEHRMPLLGFRVQKDNFLINPGDLSTSLVGDENKQRFNLLDRVWEFGPLNSAGDPFDPPIEFDVATLNLRYSRYQPFPGGKGGLNAWIDFNNTVNVGNFLGNGAQTWRLRLSGRRVIHKGRSFWAMVYDLSHRPETWITQVLDQGPHYWDAGPKGTGDRKKFKDDQQQPRIGNLDGTGKELAITAKPVFMPFKTFRERDWGALDIEGRITELLIRQDVGLFPQL